MKLKLNNCKKNQYKKILSLIIKNQPMKFSKSKNRLLLFLMSTMIMLINSCAGYGTAPTITINNYCDLALPLPQSAAVKNEMKKIKNNAIELFKFIEISAATKKCECKATDKEKQLCWKEFDNLNKK